MTDGDEQESSPANLPAVQSSDTDDVESAESDQGKLVTLQALTKIEAERNEIERQRLVRDNRRTELAFKSIETEDASDQRRYEFQLERLRTQDAEHKRRYRFANGVFMFGGGIAAVVIALIFGMLFFGDPQQSELAGVILSNVAKALGGGGFLFIVAQAMRWLVRR